MKVAVLIWLPAVLALGCGSGTSSAPDATGAAGADAAAGSTGAAGMGGAGTGGGGAGTGGAGTGGGGAGTGGGAAPSCLRDLFAACATDGACVFQLGDAGASSRQVCYASGVKARTTGASCSSTPPDSSMTTVTKPDGSLCYTVETQLIYGHACEGGASTWKDAAGTVVATAAISSGLGNTSSVTVTCSSGGAPTAYVAAGQACTPDVCP